MTARQLYEGVLIELNKENAPNIMLEDFNYFSNKAINQFINKRYNIYDINQQTTDDLRVLKATSILIPKRMNLYDSLSLTSSGMATYYVDLPSDYLHLLNCICIYNVRKTYKCYNAGDTWRAAATRLTADAYSQVLDNFWNRPTYKKPYYYIHNINSAVSSDGTGAEVPTNPINGLVIVSDSDSDPSSYNAGERVITYSDGSEVTFTYETTTVNSNTVRGALTSRSQTITSSNLVEGTDSSENLHEKGKTTYGEDGNGNSIIQGSGNPKAVKIGGEIVSNVERGLGIRYGNVSKVRLEIRYGTDSSVFTLDHKNGDKGGYIYIDYIKAPLHIRLTQEELDYTEDKSLMLEFPDYVCQEILNELVHLIMENISDLRLQTHPVVSLSIANPAQALAPEAAGKSAQ